MSPLGWLLAAPATLWEGILLLPWQPWRPCEVFYAGEEPNGDLDDIIVLLPARNEAATLPIVLAALKRQGRFEVLLIDDQSTDDTTAIAQASGIKQLHLIRGHSLPAGWNGKIWALEQGRRRAETQLLLLLDADIVLGPGVIAALKRKMRLDGLHMVSLMARLPCEDFWEKLLLPAFVYFFKMIYPFRLVNLPTSMAAAAAGGCVLIDAHLLERSGGFAAIKNAVIDDCALAKQIKSAGSRLWLGLTRQARSIPRMPRPTNVADMVARTAYAQLRFSPLLLAACTVLLVLAFDIPLAGLFTGQPLVQMLAAAGLAAMAVSYVPMLAFYRCSPLWVLALPVVANLYLAMTWLSAWRYWQGERCRWKGRRYGRPAQKRMQA